MQYLSERAFPQGVDDLVLVCKMVVINDEIVASVVVVPVVVSGVVQHRRFLLAFRTDAIDSGEIEDFFTFIFGEILVLRAFENG